MRNIRKSKRRHIKIFKKDFKIIEWGSKIIKYRFFFLIMHLRLYDYQAEASRYRKGLKHFKNRVNTNQNQTLHS